MDAQVLGCLKQIFNQHAADGKWSATQAQSFISTVQHQDAASPATAALLSRDGVDLSGFLAYMSSADCFIELPPPRQDLSQPMASYFINSSHNTYLSGNQLSSASTAEAYTSVLLRGCRCVEIDVWDGEEPDSSDTSDSDADEKGGADGKTVEKKSSWDRLRRKLPDSMGKRGDDAAVTPVATRAEPRVMHGHTLTKDVSFRDVCAAIGDSAFAVTDLPLIVSLEVHCSPEQQESMVEIMRETWGESLVEEAEAGVELPRPDRLRGKILVKVKHRPGGDEPEKRESGESDSSPPPPPDAKMAPALSRLAVYVKGVSFKHWAQPEASIPTHIFSLSEKKFLGQRGKAWEDMVAHNRRYLVRAYPSSLRIRSSNLNPALFWGGGAQVVALNWQETDEGMMLNEGMFGGTGGYVLKPEALRGEGCAVVRTLDLSVTFLAAQGIPLPPGETSSKGFRPYVKVELHVEACGGLGEERTQGGEEHKARTRTHRGCEVDFEGERVEFKGVAGVLEELSFVRFTVRDDEIGRDDLAAWACVRLDRLGEGYRFVRLVDMAGERGGVVLVRVEKHFMTNRAASH